MYAPQMPQQCALQSCKQGLAACLEGSEQLGGQHIVSLDLVQRRGVGVVCDALYRRGRSQQSPLSPFPCTAPIIQGSASIKHARALWCALQSAAPMRVTQKLCEAGVHHGADKWGCN